MIWVAAGAIGGALVAAVRSPSKNEPNGIYGGAIQLILFAATGASVGSAIYVTLADTLYH